METRDHILIAALLLATVGWILTVITNRSLSRKQHTFTALLEMSFNETVEDRITKLAPHLQEGALPDPIDPIRNDLRTLLSHYEFLAAAVHNGIVNEKLLRDSDRALIVRLIEISLPYIQGQRRKSSRKTEDEINQMYEHIIWLFYRWTDAQPCPPQQLIEFLWGRPIFPTKSNVQSRLDRN